MYSVSTFYFGKIKACIKGAGDPLNLYPSSQILVLQIKCHLKNNSFQLIIIKKKEKIEFRSRSLVSFY